MSAKNPKGQRTGGMGRREAGSGDHQYSYVHARLETISALVSLFVAGQGFRQF